MNSLYSKNAKPYIIIALVTLISTLILWSPFILKVKTLYGIDTPDLSFSTVLRHWDGPLYIIPAKTLYDKNHPLMIYSTLGLGTEYFAAHLPLYPLTLKIFQPFVGYPKATVVSTLLSAIGLFSFFFYLLKKFKLTKNPLLLTFVFMFFSPRFFVTRSVGTPEPLFLLLILASVFYFVEKRYLLAGLFGGIAITAKTPAGLLFVAYSLFLLRETWATKKFNYKWLGILLIPGGLLLVFSWYYVALGDFFAYFNSGDNLHLSLPPFQIFNFQRNWVGTGWLEEILYIYFFYALVLVQLYPYAGTTFLKAKDGIVGRVKTFFASAHDAIEEKIIGERAFRFNRISFYFTLVFFIAIISVQHRDIARYSIPLLPFGLIAFERFFTSKKFLIALIILIPAIYIYSWNFMVYNVIPNSDWTPFL